MLANHDVIVFVATADAERAKAFYTSVLGLRLVSDEAYALVLDVHGTMLRIQKAKEVVVAPYTALGWRVADIVAEVRALAQRGVTFTRYPGMGQDDLGIWTAPDGTKVAWFRDPDGNTLSLTQF